MQVKEIDGGMITLEMEAIEALDIAHAFALIAGDHDEGAAKDRLFWTYRALFETLAVAGFAQGSIVKRKEQKAVRFTALLGTKK